MRLLATDPVSCPPGRLVKPAPDPAKVPAVKVPETVPLETKNVAPDCRLFVSWMAFPRLLMGTLPERFAAVRLVRLAAFKVGRFPEPPNCTSWLIPLKVFPCFVTLEESMRLLATEPVSCPPGRLVNPAPDPEKVPAVNVPDTVPLETKKVAPVCRLLASWIALPRLAMGTLPERFAAVREVKLAAFKDGRFPEEFN